MKYSVIIPPPPHLSSPWKQKSIMKYLKLRFEGVCIYQFSDEIIQEIKASDKRSKEGKDYQPAHNG